VAKFGRVAERDDSEYRVEVAIKLLKGGLETAEAVAHQIGCPIW
jgi:hypothetical protein